MDLVSLGGNMQPWKFIENYESLIWTERYSTNGDFELVSYDIAETMALLPLESYVTLTESTVPMVVETYLIQKPLRGAPNIKVLGRSFETVLERRASVNAPLGPPKSAAWTIGAAKQSDAAYQAIRTVLGDEQDRYFDGDLVFTAVSPAVSLSDAIDEIDLIMPADFEPFVAPYNYDIKPGNLYVTAMELINANHHGMKAIRPEAGSFKIGVEIYNGANLTEGPDAVVFDARFDQLDDAKYLLSKQGSRNVAYVYGVNGSQVVLKTAAEEPYGLDRRVLLLDETSDATTNSADIRTSRGLVELYKYNSTALFDGQVAVQVAQGYNSKYFLGDILKLTGEFGLSQNVRVAEFIRTSDNTGVKAYPAFEAVD